MKMVKRRVLIGAAMAFGALAAPVMAQNLTGGYAVEGRNPDGSAYAGDVEMTHSANVVSMAWRVGADSYIGTGTQEGRIVTIHWGDATPVVYVVMPNGSLHGTWADGLALEKLTPN